MRGSPRLALSTRRAEAADDGLRDVDEVAVMHPDAVGVCAGMEHHFRITDETLLDEHTLRGTSPPNGGMCAFLAVRVELRDLSLGRKPKRRRCRRARAACRTQLCNMREPRRARLRRRRRRRLSWPTSFPARGEIAAACIAVNAGAWRNISVGTGFWSGIRPGNVVDDQHPPVAPAKSGGKYSPSAQVDATGLTPITLPAGLHLRFAFTVH